MPTVSLKKRLYDNIVKAGLDTNNYVNEAVEEKLEEEGILEEKD